MTSEEIARSLALDRRTPRDFDHGRDAAGYVAGKVIGAARWRILTLENALRDLLAVIDAPQEHGFCWNDPKRRRMQEIRALAAKP
jgi:hypothetical protein